MQNYRPTSNLTFISKISEKAEFQQLKVSLTEKASNKCSLLSRICDSELCMCATREHFLQLPLLALAIERNQREKRMSQKKPVPFISQGKVVFVVLPTLSSQGKVDFVARREQRTCRS